MCFGKIFFIQLEKLAEKKLHVSRQNVYRDRKINVFVVLTQKLYRIQEFSKKLEFYNTYNNENRTIKNHTHTHKIGSIEIMSTNKS